MPRPAPLRAATAAAAVAAITAATVAVAAQTGDPSPLWSQLLAGLLVGVLVTVSAFSAGPLSVRLGPWTATAAVSVTWGAVFAAVAALSGAPLAELASFALFGFLVPIVAMVAVRPFMWMVRTGRVAVRRVRGQRPPRNLYALCDVTPAASTVEIRRKGGKARAAARRAGDDRLHDAIDAAIALLCDDGRRAAYDSRLSARIGRAWTPRRHSGSGSEPEREETPR